MNAEIEKRINVINRLKITLNDLKKKMEKDGHSDAIAFEISELETEINFFEIINRG